MLGLFLKISAIDWQRFTVIYYFFFFKGFGGETRIRHVIINCVMCDHVKKN